MNKKHILLLSIISVFFINNTLISTNKPIERQNVNCFRNNRLGSGCGFRNGSGQRKLDGTGPRGRNGQCLNISNSKPFLKNGLGQRKLNGTGPRGQNGQCLKNL